MGWDELWGQPCGVKRGYHDAKVARLAPALVAGSDSDMVGASPTTRQVLDTMPSGLMVNLPAGRRLAVMAVVAVVTKQGGRGREEERRGEGGGSLPSCGAAMCDNPCSWPITGQG